MKVAVAGSTGLIGSRLCKELEIKNWEVIPLYRSDLKATDDALKNKMKGVDIVINLAGAPILQRWTEKNRAEIYNSRVIVTRNMVHAIHDLDASPMLFISISATGIYESGGPYTESNALLSSSFLGKLCQDWEREAFQAEDFCRVVVFRLGAVIDKHGGALPRLLTFFSKGLGGTIGKGKQYFPWISLTDVIRAFFWSIEKQDIKGVLNLTAPEIINNKEFTAILSEILHKPAILPIPPIALKILFGKGSSVLTDGQAVIPQRLTNSGFAFHFPQIRTALSYLLKK